MTPWLSSGALRERLLSYARTSWRTWWAGVWGSVMCSSDLRVASALVSPPATLVSSMVPLLVKAGRSEERRVGKECRSWRRRKDEKKVVRLQRDAQPILLYVKGTNRDRFLISRALLAPFLSV